MFWGRIIIAQDERVKVFMPSRFDALPIRTMTKLTLDVETATVEAAKEQERPAKVFAALLAKRVGQRNARKA